MEKYEISLRAVFVSTNLHPESTAFDKGMTGPQSSPACKGSQIRTVSCLPIPLGLLLIVYRYLKSLSAERWKVSRVHLNPAVGTALVFCSALHISSNPRMQLRDVWQGRAPPRLPVRKVG